MENLDPSEEAMDASRRRGKKIKVPEPLICPFTVCVDNREQAPWHFTGIEGDSGEIIIVPLLTGQPLATGDYTIAGLEHRLIIERKSPGDFRGSITADRDRFEREMERMREVVRAPGGGYAAVVIEASMTDLLTVPESSRVNPVTIARTMQSWSIRYGVHFWMLPDRRVAEIWAFRLMQMFWRQQ